MPQFLSFGPYEDEVVYASPLPVRLAGCSFEYVPGQNANQAAGLESMARILEDLIPKAKNEFDKQFCRHMAEQYKASAREILRRASQVREGSHEAD